MCTHFTCVCIYCKLIFQGLSSGTMASLDDEALAAWRAFLAAHARITRRISGELMGAGLPDLAWYDLLWSLYRVPGQSLRVSELAHEVALSPTGMSRFVDRVQAAGCVRREPDPRDRRALQVVLTDAGVDLLRRMWPIYERGIAEHFAAHLGRSARPTRLLLERMANAAAGAGSDAPSRVPTAAAAARAGGRPSGPGRGARGRRTPPGPAP
jgi:DNA-binding MarR family transcriptional regulator